MSAESKNILKIVEEFEKNRIFWLRLSGFVCVVMIIMIFQWDRIMVSHTQWVFVSLGIIVSSSWWYWIMKLVRANLKQMKNSAIMLDEVIVDIGSLKIYFN